MHAYLMLTHRCNLCCRHCIRLDDNAGNDLAMADAVRALEEIASSKRFDALFLTGGEPTLHVDFRRIVWMAYARFEGEIRVCTNGVTPFFCQDSLESLKDMPRLSVQFSIDGDQKEDDRIRGAGHYRKVMRAIGHATAIGVRVAVSSVVDRQNMSSMFELHQTLADQGVCHWLLSPEMPFGRAVDHEPVPCSEWNAFVDEILATGRICIRITKLFDIAAMSRLTDVEIKTMATTSVPHCGSASQKIYIHPDLTVHPCTCLTNHPLGHLGNESLDSIIGGREAQFIRVHAILPSSPCASCRFYPICRGGCLGMSYHSFGVLNAGDSRCPLF